MKLFIFILLSFCFLNSHLVYATSCFKPNPVEKDQKPNPVQKNLELASKKVSVASNKQIQKPIPKHVLEQAQKSVWQIGDSLGNGTGFFISPNQFVTNFHVVAGLLKKNFYGIATNLLKKNFYDVVLSQKDGHKTLKIKKVKHLSPQFDLAVLEIEGEVSDYLNLAKKDPQLKENLSSIGYPNGKFKIINKTYDISYENELEYSFSVDHSNTSGASGSPVLNKEGEVVGVSYNGNENQKNVIKIIHLKNLLKQDPPFFENSKDHLEHSIKELELLAESGDMIAQFRLGFLHQTGVGVKRDFKKAARWIKKAAEQGYAPAQSVLGLLYISGLGVKKNFKEGVYWLRKAAEQGFVIAQINLGLAYEKGLGVKKDLEESVRLYRQAAGQGHATAQLNLGLGYGNRLGVKKDLEEAVYWLRKSAEQGNFLAQYELGFAYAKGLGVEQDPEEANYWHEKVR